MPVSFQKKTHPCEGCRERKKKCSGEYPCTRCQRLGIECVFLQPTLPPDYAYADLLQQQQLASEVEIMEAKLLTLQTLLYQVRRQQQKEKWQCVSDRLPVALDWQLTLGKKGMSVNTTIRSYADLLKQVQLWQQACHTLLSPTLPRSPAPFPSSSMVLRRQLPLWLLRRGHFMAIMLCVDDQRSNMHQPVSPPQQQPSPPLSDHHPRLDREEEKEETEHMPVISSSNVDPLPDADKLCRHILDIFFHCFLVRNVILHERTFYRLYVHSFSSPYNSPAVCAACAVALTVRCKRMLSIIPYHQQEKVAEMYFCRARNLVSFDEPTLETFTTLVFLAMYKQMTFCVDDAAFYMDLAFRTRCLLVRDRNGNSDKDIIDIDINDECSRQDSAAERQGTLEMVKRLHWGIWEVQTSVEYYNNQRGVPRSTTSSASASSLKSTAKPPHPLVSLMRNNVKQFIRRPLPDESEAIRRSIQNANYRTDMWAKQGSFLRQVRFEKNDSFDLSYLVETDYRFTKFYQDLPDDYRMPPTLFEPGLSDQTFRKKLEDLWGTTMRSSPVISDHVMCTTTLMATTTTAGGKTDDDQKMAALNMTLQYYQGVISLYESFLPDFKERKRAQLVGLLKEDGDTPNIGKNATTNAADMAREKTSSSTSTASRATDHHAQHSNDAPLSPASSRTTSDTETEITMHQLQAQEKCTQAAIHIVRLLDYQRRLSNHCNVNVHILLTAWDIHVRNACLGMTIPPLSSITATKRTTAGRSDNGGGCGDGDDGDNEIRYFGCLSLKMIYQARQSLLQCLSILREGYMFNFAEHSIWRYYETLEQQLHASFPMASPPSASYWIPYGL